jgi:hypothetical protein
MSVFKPRNKLVNFRLSDEEFEKLRLLCPLHGARSISDFARSSVLERLDQTPRPALAAPPLDAKVDQLESRVEQLLNLINAVGFTKPASAPAVSRTEVFRPPDAA